MKSTLGHQIKELVGAKGRFEACGEESRTRMDVGESYSSGGGEGRGPSSWMVWIGRRLAVVRPHGLAGDTNRRPGVDQSCFWDVEFSASTTPYLETVCRWFVSLAVLESGDVHGAVEASNADVPRLKGGQALRDCSS